MDEFVSKSQMAEVLDILLKKGEISNFFCIDTRLTLSLKLYIHRLRRKGYVIESDYNRDTKNTTYRLIATPQDYMEA